MGAVRNILVASVLAVHGSASAVALTLEQCTRVVRGWNGWEIQHRDLGHGRVSYRESWNAEGIYLDLIVSDCASGETVRTRVREEMVKPRPAFDRTRRGLDVIDRHARRAPALFRISVLAEDLAAVGEDTVVTVAAMESCACAALYPEHRGPKTEFEGN
ncbi:MAG: hypothetical protein AAF646_13810 [Pseudomonadota bacterium]